MQATITLSDEDLQNYTDSIGYEHRSDADESRDVFFKRRLQEYIVDVLRNYATVKAEAAARVAAAAQASTPDVTVE